MKKSYNSFFITRVRNFRYAFEEACLLFLTERFVITRLFLAMLSVFIGHVSGITKTRRLFQIPSIGPILTKKLLPHLLGCSLSWLFISPIYISVHESFQ